MLVTTIQIYHENNKYKDKNNKNPLKNNRNMIFITPLGEFFPKKDCLRRATDVHRRAP